MITSNNEQNIQNKKQKENNTFEKHTNCQYFKLDDDELSTSIKCYINCHGMDFDF